VEPQPQPQVIATFPEDYPASLAVSPDGSKIAFTVGDPGNLTDHVWVMNADGSGQRQLTASTLNETSPAWSPDGSTIAVRQGVTSWAGGPTPGLCPTVYLVPADATNAALPEENPAPAYRLLMMEDGKARNVCAFSHMDWR
jgi:dipeptidyl aminopeptidase/acylaminoacyl peptidase